MVHLSWNGARVPAVVTFVWSDTRVRLAPLAPIAGIDEIACQHEAESVVSAAQPNHMVTTHGTWAWPPRT